MLLEYDKQVVPAPGVRVERNIWTCGALDARVDMTSADEVGVALDVGIAERHSRLLCGKNRATVLLWRSRSAVLQDNVWEAVGQSLAFFSRGFLSTGVLAGLALWLGLARRDALMVGIGGATLLFLFSVLVHEVGHVTAFRMMSARGTGARVVSSGLSCRLVRPVGTRAVDLVTILAGPFAPLALLPILGVLARPAPWLIWGWAGIAIGHIVVLLIPVGDGATLRDALRGSAPPRRLGEPSRVSSGPHDVAHDTSDDRDHAERDPDHRSRFGAAHDRRDGSSDCPGRADHDQA